jgi:lipooligosaccharide transport system permease protein
LLLAWPLLGLVGIVFASIALIFNALAKGYDFFTYYFTLFLTPTMFLSGVFFPRDQLPGFMQAISDFLPLTAAVELIRPLFMGHWPAQGFLHLAVLLAYAVVAFWVALALTRKRFRS